MTIRNPTRTGRGALAAAGPAGGLPAGPRRRALLLVLSATMLIDALEVSIVIIALPAISAGLHVTVATASWVMTGFALGFGGMLLFGGRVADLVGRRRVYLAALLCYAVACVIGGLAASSALLIATRVARGCCAALTAPTGLGIISSTFPDGAPRHRALAVYSGFGASGFTAGLLLSGLLTQVQWHWTFLFPAPVALVLLAIGWRVIPGSPAAAAPSRPAAAGGTAAGGTAAGGTAAGSTAAGSTAHPAGTWAALLRRYDLVGAVTFAGGTALLVYAIATAPQHGTHLTLAGVAAAAALLAGFAVTERRAAQPLLPLRLLANGPLIRSGLGAAALNGSYWGLLLLTTFRLQDGQGWSPPWAAAALLPASVPPMLAAPFSRHLIRWAGPPRLILAGALAATTGYALALASSPTAPYLSRTLPALLLVGAGYVCAFAALHASVLAGVPASQARVTTGVYQAFVQIGGALVLAVLAALFVAAQRGAGQAAAGPWHAVAVSYRPATAIITAVSAIGVAAALAGQGPPMRRAERARSRRRADR